MALRRLISKIIPANGTRLYIMDIPEIPWVDCVDAIQDITLHAIVVECLQTLGAIEFERATTVYKCMSSDNYKKLMGSKMVKPFTFSMLSNPTTSSVQIKLKEYFDTNTEFVVAIELSDGENGSNGSFYYAKGYVSKVSTKIDKDDAVKYEVEVSIYPDVVRCEKNLSTNCWTPLEKSGDWLGYNSDLVNGGTDAYGAFYPHVASDGTFIYALEVNSVTDEIRMMFGTDSTTELDNVSQIIIELYGVGPIVLAYNDTDKNYQGYSVDIGGYLLPYVDTVVCIYSSVLPALLIYYNFAELETR